MRDMAGCAFPLAILGVIVAPLAVFMLTGSDVATVWTLIGGLALIALFMIAVEVLD